MTNNKHKPHRTPTWKRDILLLTSLLRLRVQPSIPYSLIAFTILSHFHDPVIRFYTRYACPSPSDPNFNEEALLLWLATWLEEKYVHAEKWLEECFLQAIAKEDIVVEQVLEVCEFLEQGFELKDEGEWRRQVRWLKEGDWRAGSRPLGAGQGGEGEFGAIGEPAPAPITKEEESEEGKKRRECVDAELLERLRNLEVEDDQPSILAPQAVHVQPFLPPTLALEPSPTTWGNTLNPRTPIFHPFQWTPGHTPALEKPTTATIFYDPYTGQILDFNQTEDPQVMQEYFPQPEVYVDPKKASLAMRLQNKWNGFSEQLDEIKAMEEMLSQKQAARKEVVAYEMYFSGN